MTPAALLTAARALLVRGWCQGAHARDAAGAPVLSFAPSAASWCLLGATARAAHEAGLFGSAEHFAADALLAAAARSRVDGWGARDVVALLNDRLTTQAEALAVVDAALAGVER